MTQGCWIALWILTLEIVFLGGIPRQHVKHGIRYDKFHENWWTLFLELDSGDRETLKTKFNWRLEKWVYVWNCGWIHFPSVGSLLVPGLTLNSEGARRWGSWSAELLLRGDTIVSCNEKALPALVEMQLKSNNKDINVCQEVDSVDVHGFLAQIGRRWFLEGLPELPCASAAPPSFNKWAVKTRSNCACAECHLVCWNPW